MLVLLSAALAGTSSIQFVVGGETLVVNHGEYCSFPKLAGVTTETLAPIVVPAWDAMFDPAELKRSFSGLVLYDDESPTRAHPLRTAESLAHPGPDAPRWVELLGTCRLVTLEGNALPEILRKSSTAGRAVLVRVLANEAITSTSCGHAQQPALVQDALSCGSGKCGPFLDRLTALQTQRCD